jgi:hypothetical protein
MMMTTEDRIMNEMILQGGVDAVVAAKVAKAVKVLERAGYRLETTTWNTALECFVYVFIQPQRMSNGGYLRVQLTDLPALRAEAELYE